MPPHWRLCIAHGGLYVQYGTRVRWHGAYYLQCCKAACLSHCLPYSEEDVTTAVGNAARLGVGLAKVCADVIESLNTILKQAYNNHMAGGKGGLMGSTALEREGEMMLPVESFFFQFDLRLRNYATPHTVLCTMARLMATQRPPPPSSKVASPPLALSSPVHGPKNSAKAFGGHAQEQSTLGVFLLRFCMFCLGQSFEPCD